MTIKFTDAAKYYREKPHQVAAFEYLQRNVADEVIDRFEYLYRNPNAGNLPPDIKTSERAHIAKILNRIKDLGISLDKPPQNAQNDEYCVNIIGLEGLNPDFTTNDDRSNHFNDLFIILGINKDLKFRYLQKSVGTTEPGHHYTFNRMNPKGAARIQLDVKHEKIWQYGKHGRGKNRHNALVQWGGPVCVHRDDNEDTFRTGDVLDCGYHGINFHGGYDMPTSNIGGASAGCQVIQKMGEIASAMEHIKNDYYFIRDEKHRFSYIALDASKIF